jgi:hypothetical protein
MGSLKNNFTFWTPMHPVRLCCKNSEYSDIPAFLRLAGRAPQHPKLRTYFFVNPNPDGGIKSVLSVIGYHHFNG